MRQDGATDPFGLAALAADFIRGQTGCDRIDFGLVLGSGLSGLTGMLADPVEVAYPGIPGFVRASVAGHPGVCVTGKLGGLTVAAMAGRMHAYEGHPVWRVVHPVRTLARLGASVVVLTNAAGAVNRSYRPGDLMLIGDHLNLTGLNPLTGPNDESIGPRFPDLQAAWSPRLRRLLHQTAAGLGLKLREGVYAALPGPSYETPAEVRMLQRLGADATGMSTVAEAIAARHLGLELAGISCITNRAAGIGGAPLDHAEVQAVGREAATAIGRLAAGLFERLAGGAA